MIRISNALLLTALPLFAVAAPEPNQLVILAGDELVMEQGRITASADLLDEDLPSLTGLCRSWEGLDHLQSGSLAGRSIPPVYQVKETHESDGGRFLTWLVSGEPADPTASPIDQIVGRASRTAGVLAALNALPDVATDPFANIRIIPSTADPLDEDDDYVFEAAAVHPLCEAVWRHDPRSRNLIIIIDDKKRNVPRILSFSDFRG